MPRSNPPPNGGLPQALPYGPFLRRREIALRATLSIPCMHGTIKRGVAPPYLHPGPGIAGWFESQADAFLESRIDARDSMRCLLDPVVLPLWEPRSPSGRYPPGIRMMTRAQVCVLLGVSPSTLFRWIQRVEHPLPRPVPLTERRRAWVEYEIKEWIRGLNERSAVGFNGPFSVPGVGDIELPAGGGLADRPVF